jgi:hypothetical protein
MARDDIMSVDEFTASEIIVMEFEIIPTVSLIAKRNTLVARAREVAFLR